MEAARAVWTEPRAPEAEGPGVRDRVLLGVVVVAACVETALRSDMVWRLPSLVVVVLCAAVLPWRRVRSLAVATTAVGVASVVQLAALARDVSWEGLITSSVFLLLPYSIGRWGSGREALGGAAVFAVSITLAGIAGDPVGDVIGGVVIVLLAGALGAGVRYRKISHRQQVDSIRSRERAELARELHDSVAHHVSAIAVQAQAGRLVVRTDADAVADVLAVIEEQASRTLDEMRSMVGALRDGDQPELLPQQGVHDIERLAGANGTGPPVAVELDGALHDLRPSVDSALFRLAREAITNARRHAHHATCVTVRVVGDDVSVRLTVDDDGTAVGDGAAPGYGLVGMAERVKLLGGSLSAGPVSGGGWNVTAVLPRDGASR